MKTLELIKLPVLKKRGRPRLSDDEKAKRLEFRKNSQRAKKAWLTRQNKNQAIETPAPKKRGRPRLSDEEKTKRLELRLKNKKPIIAKIPTNAPNVDWRERIGKEIGREIIVESVKISKTKGRKILTLPAEFCILEKKVLAEVSDNFQFVACEMDGGVFARLQKNIKNENLPIAAHHCKIEEIINKAKANEYAHAFLDYCQTLTKHHEDLEKTLKNNIVQRGGTIVITLTTRCGGYFVKNLVKNIPDEAKHKRESLIALNVVVSKYGHGNYFIEKMHLYRDGAPMLLAVIRRIK